MAGFGTSKILTQFRPLTCAAATACHSGRLAAHPPDLIKWVRREGGLVHQSVRIAASADSCGLGLVASQDIPKGSELITLPHHIPLRFSPLESEDVDAVDPVLANLARQVPEELWAMRLGLKLLQERAAIGSFWWPYISNLPETYSVPIFFPGEDIKNLQYAPLLYQGAAVSVLPNMEQNPSKLCLAYEQFFNFSNHNKFPGFAPVVGFPWVHQLKCILFDTHYAEVNKRCRFLLDFEKEVKCVMENLKPEDHPFRGQDVNASSLGWAMSAVSSRAFRLHGKKLADGTHVDVPMMLPLIDMCNHSFNPNAHIVQEQDAGSTKMLIKVVAETEIKQDDNLLLNYGCLNNDFFLLDYGFVIPSNPYDSIELKYDGALLDAASMAAGVTSPNFSSPAPWQQRILSQLNLDGEAPVLKVSLGGSELVEGRLLAALRVLLAADPETVQKHDLETLKLLAAEAPIGISNEVAALRTVIALCVIALGHFPTKIMEDEALLKQGASVSAELAIQFRIQKKSVIIDVMRSLTRRVKLLSSKEKISAQG